MVRKKTDIANTVIILVIGLFTLLCVAPVIHIIAVSFSSNTAIFGSKVTFVPIEPNIKAYEAIVADPSMIYSLFYTIVITVLAASISMAMSVAAAYALSKKRLKGRAFFMIIIIFTMYFSGGIIPDYLLIKKLGMLNTIWCLVIPGAVSAYYMIILKTFFQEMPESIEESAYMDGANDITVLLKIVIPLSGPVLATITLFYAVGRWNYFQDALFYITKTSLYTLQLKLYNIIKMNRALDVSAVEGISSAVLPASVKAAVIVFATVPILIAYPWLQRYFIKGVMIGGIKG
ncbi:MAG: carbohydrate ABC transporter permease [Spirochaetales bacterium]|nr:carbohydrate ABC transporter permease [Spirochaetales bacterium]